jgi:hypothetical protein
VAALIPGQTTIDAIIQTAQQRSDLINGGPIPYSDWNTMAQQALYELYGIIIQSWGDNYKVSAPCFSFTTDGSSMFYPMPTDYLKVLLVENMQVQNNQNCNFTMERRSFQEKNRYSTPYMIAGWTGSIPYYDVFDEQLVLFPLAQAGLIVNVYYVPRFTAPTSSGTITLSNVVATNVITINGVTLTGITGSTSGANFHVGPTDTTTASALVTAINGSSLATSMTASSTNNVVTLTFANTLRVGTVTITNPSATFSMYPDTTWTNLVDGYNGFERLAVADTIIQARARLDMDIGVFAAEKQAMIKRVNAETKNRDGGNPLRTIRRRGGSNGGWGGGWN